MTPTISVLLPCFNAEETIENALDSIVKQSFEDFEIIAIDDGSSDSTPEILRKWSEQDRRIRLITQSHRGIIPALNSGVRESGGAFIARMDADDLSHPQRFAKQMEFLEHNPEIAVVSCLVEGYPPDRIQEGYKLYYLWLNSLVSSEQIAREIYIESPLAHPSVMIRRRSLEKAGGYQEHGWPEDYDLWLRLHLAGEQFAKVPEILLSWREHSDRLTRTDSRYSVENFIRAKSFYLCQGPLAERDAVIIWGAGQMGRRISKHLHRNGAPLKAFIDIDPKKIGRMLRSFPIHPIDDLLAIWKSHKSPALLAAVGSRGARSLIRTRLENLGFMEAVDWWAVA
jgi:glycosyltransferase involved in cell wall biosynthesis